MHFIGYVMHSIHPNNLMGRYFIDIGTLLLPFSRKDIFCIFNLYLTADTGFPPVIPVLPSVPRDTRPLSTNCDVLPAL